MERMLKQMMQLAIDDQDRYFREYLNLIKTTIDTKMSELEAKDQEIKEDLESKNSEYREQANDYLADLAYEVSQLEQLLYRSFIVSVFMFMEDLSAQLCRHLQKQNDQKFAYTDLKGNGIGRSIQYLKTVLSSDFPKDETVKEQFKVAWIIRNAVVHADGKLNKDKRPFIEGYIKKDPGILEISFLGDVTISYDFAEKLLELNSKFAKEISDNWLVDF